MINLKQIPARESSFTVIFVFSAAAKPFKAEAATSRALLLGPRHRRALAVVACGDSTRAGQRGRVCGQLRGVCSAAPPCLTLGSPVDCSPPGSSVRGTLQARHWSGSPCPPPGDLPHPGAEPTSPAFPELQVDSSLLSHWGS